MWLFLRQVQEVHFSLLFSTDTTAALRASEIGADVIFKATMVDGVYDSDPKKNADAVRYDEIQFQTCISQQLKVMDATAFTLCMDNNIPIIIFDIGGEGNISAALTGKDIGTIVHDSAKV